MRRRWLAAIVLAGVGTASVAGCHGSSGRQDDVADGWSPAVARPTAPFVPAAGTCHLAVEDVGHASTYQPVDCAEVHLAETVDVLAFTGSDAALPAVPETDSPAGRAARTQCETKVNEFLGGDWHAGRLALTLVLPSGPAWAGGARWYRCDVSETDSLDNTKAVGRRGSLAGALRPGSPLAHTCFDPKMIKEELNYLEPVPCTSAHHAEFAGIYIAPDRSWEEFQRDGKGTHRACLGVIAGFAKVPDDGDLQYRAGSIYYPPSREEWLAGDRGVRCFLWVGDRTLKRSVRGAGAKGLPAA
ncbi:septum formation family protein [Micromonospora sp. NPDC049559]|uniref:septum formation family protein n=1 Tax=Micromonospora sp. NPDC049559 TaxID=3155923 RepID=UPI00342870CD